LARYGSIYCSSIRYLVQTDALDTGLISLQINGIDLKIIFI